MTIQINNLNGNVNIYNNERERGSLNDAATQPNDTAKPSNDVRLKRLFLNTYGDEDPQRTEEERNRFLNYLSDHHLSSRPLDSSRDHPTNKAIICFCRKWRRLSYIKDPISPAAVVRFLTDTCGLTCDVDPATIATVLGKMLKADYDKEVYFDMDNYFN